MPTHETLHPGVSSLVARQLVAPGQKVLKLLLTSQISPGESSLTVRVGTGEGSLSCMKSSVSLEMGEFVVRLPTSPVLTTVRLPPAVLAVLAVAGCLTVTGEGGGAGREADDEVAGGVSTGVGSGEGGRGVRDDGGSRLHLPLLVVVHQRDLDQ